jgi:hypothetical protein
MARSDLALSAPKLPIEFCRCRMHTISLLTLTSRQHGTVRQHRTSQRGRSRQPKGPRDPCGNFQLARQARSSTHERLFSCGEYQLREELVDHTAPSRKRKLEEGTADAHQEKRGKCGIPHSNELNAESEAQGDNGLNRIRLESMVENETEAYAHRDKPAATDLPNPDNCKYVPAKSVK